MSKQFTETWVTPADRPRNICFSKVLDTAADCDVAIREIYAIRKTGAGLIACIGFSETDDNANVYPLSAEELIDCCEKGCYITLIDSVTDGITMCIKPFQWGLMALDDTVSCAYAALQALDMSAASSTRTTETTATTETVVLYSSELVAVVEASGADQK